MHDVRTISILFERLLISHALELPGFFFFSSRRRHTISLCDWSSDVCSSDLFALGNFLGPLLLGPLFDTVGRKPMIAFTYAISGVLLAAVGWLFRESLVDAAELTACWTVIFFFASATASTAYLTVSESFPLAARALAIAFFYAVGTGICGVASPRLMGLLIGTGERGEVFLGYLLGAALMIAAALVELAIGIKAERQPLEHVARPLSSV